MAWRLIEIDDSEAVETDLTDGELLGVSIMITHNTSPEDRTDRDVYWRARQKIRQHVDKALTNKEGDN